MKQCTSLMKRKKQNTSFWDSILLSDDWYNLTVFNCEYMMQR